MSDSDPNKNLTPEQAHKRSICSIKLPDLRLLVDHQKGEVIVRSADKRGYLVGQMFLTTQQAKRLGRAIVRVAARCELNHGPSAFECDEDRGVNVLIDGPPVSDGDVNEQPTEGS